jgi:hypothetical protein
LTIASLAVGVALLGLLVVNERRAEQPIMPLRPFASRERSGAYAARILFLGAMVGFWFFITRYLQIVHDYSALQAGLGFLRNWLLLAGGLASAHVDRDADRRWAGRDAQSADRRRDRRRRHAGRRAGLWAGQRRAPAGGSLGLGILVTIFATAGTSALTGSDLLAHRVSVALTAGSVVLAFALITVIALIVRPLKSDDVGDGGLVVAPAAAAGAQLAADPFGRRTR